MARPSRSSPCCWLSARRAGLSCAAGFLPVKSNTATGSSMSPEPAPRRLVIATGGPSIPKLGASGYAYDLARQFGLKVVQPRPALVPLTLSAEDALFRELSGVSTEVVAKAGKAAFREAALFTHRGLSGPAILQISSYLGARRRARDRHAARCSVRLAAAGQAPPPAHHFAQAASARACLTGSPQCWQTGWA